MTRVIGLISGTSVDGIDAALVDISGSQTELRVQLLARQIFPYPEGLRSQILEVCSGSLLSMAQLAELDEAIAREFATAALTISTGYEKAELIGSHGQTVFHRPRRLGKADRSRSSGAKEKLPKTEDTPERGETEAGETMLGYSIQLGRGATIAQLTGITTVSNFRAEDIAVGGEGAPLVSKMDAFLLSDPKRDRAVQNLGGIGNVTYLPRRFSVPPASNETGLEITSSVSEQWCDRVLGWDTGPGNSLLDLATVRLSQGEKTYDKDGEWAAKGVPCQELVEKWLQQEFFQQRPPKSTGRELFGRDYLDSCFADAEAYNLSDADMLATLTELTVASIHHSYRSFLPKLPEQVLLGGGGSHNLYLKQRLQVLLQPAEVLTTAEVGLDMDFKEAIAFAVLAYWRSLDIPGNLPQVTGASAAVLLGEIARPLPGFAPAS